MSNLAIATGNKIKYLCSPVVRSNYHRLIPFWTKSVGIVGPLNRSSSTNAFDPRLRNFLLEFHDKFNSGFKNASTAKEKNFVLDSRHVQPVIELTKKFIQTENDMKELEVLSKGGNFNLF